MNKTIDSKGIARSIKDVRLKNNLTQIEMADVLGYSERQIRRLETDGTFNLEVLNLIALTFNVSIMDILSNGMS
jgi:transcriptional regulator with XRE-family HTH domain